MQGLQADDLEYDFLSGDEAGEFVDDRRDDFYSCVVASEAAFSEMLDSLGDAPEDFFIAVAQYDGEIVAFTYGVFRDTNVQSGWVVVAPGCRGAGIASMLHSTMVEHLSDLDVTEVRQVAATDLGEAFLYRQGYDFMGGRNFRLAI
jgi:GNAT superfamily N-acetyltransferase